MEVRITRVEQIGPTVGVWGTDGVKEVMVQIIDLPPDATGIFSALHTQLAAPPFIEKPSEPGGVEPIEIEPVVMPKEKLDAAARVVKERYEKLTASQKVCAFEEAVLVGVGKAKGAL